MVFKAQGQPMTDQEIRDLIDEIDEDGNGTVEFEEFCTLIAQNLQQVDLKEEFIAAFSERDANKNGFCSKAELRQVLKSLESPKNPLTDADIQTMVQEAGPYADSDGQVNYQSFVQHMMAA